MTAAVPILELEGVSKHYPGTLAVSEVDFTLYPGEVHAIIGENGAGKSTLMKIICGHFNDYSGRIRIQGEPVQLHAPGIAKALGIVMVFQELNLAAPLSVAENLFAGRLPVKGWRLDRQVLRSEAARWLACVGLDIDPMTCVEELSPHDAQLVEIAKALSQRPRLLVLDEPTSALTQDEVERLFRVVRDLKTAGLGIIYISHHLPEVFDIADRITVLRDGRRVATYDAHSVSALELVEQMIGHAPSDMHAQRRRRPGQVRLRVNGLTRWGFFHECSFEVRGGEILGLAGLAGSGRSELARSLCAIDPCDAGRVMLDGREIAPKSYASAIRHGLAYLPEDRKSQGLALRLTARENVLSAVIPRACRAGVYWAASQSGLLQRLFQQLQVHPAEPDREVATFSGGNQQKLLLGKWLATDPEVLVLDEPTRGVDVGAKAVIHQAIADAADRGKAVLLISSDLRELVGLSDRVIILRQGRIIGELEGEACTEKAVLLAANGEWEAARASTREVSPCPGKVKSPAGEPREVDQTEPPTPT